MTSFRSSSLTWLAVVLALIGSYSLGYITSTSVMFTMSRHISAVPTSTPTTPVTLRMLIPLYSCPSDQDGSIWERVAQAAEQVPITVIWGIICEEDDYLAALERLGSADVQRLAYVATSDSRRPLGEIRAKVNFYLDYPIDGFFFDEVNPDEARWLYNIALVDSVKKSHPEAAVVLNAPYAPPTFVDVTDADAVVIFENTWEDWLHFQIAPYVHLPAHRMAALIHSTPAFALSHALELTRIRHVGLVYVTDRGWDDLPSYFREEVRWLTQLES